MGDLLIVRCKPNPTGKDKTPGGVPKPEQLLGEWVDIKNDGSGSISISSIQLKHRTFNDKCEPTDQESYWKVDGTGLLDPGQILRVHTGRKTDEGLMKEEDKGNVNWRSFANKDRFLLNNHCGDMIIVTWQGATGKTESDSASYDKDPQEGKILLRNGSKLV